MQYLLYFVTITLTNDNFSAVQLIDDPCLATCLVVCGTSVSVCVRVYTLPADVFFPLHDVCDKDEMFGQRSFVVSIS